MASITIPAFITEAAFAVGDAAAAAGTAVGTAGAAVGGEVAAGAGALGVGATTAADIGAVAGPALVQGGIGAALGAGTAALTGGDPLKGAEIGGITGGVTGGATGALGIGGGAVPGGGTASAASSAAPASVDAGANAGLPGITPASLNLQSTDTSNLVSGALGSTAPNAGTTMAGSVGQGAATGAATNTAGITPAAAPAAPAAPVAATAPAAAAPNFAGGGTLADAPTTGAFANIAQANPGYFDTFGGTTEAGGGGILGTGVTGDDITKFAPLGVSVLGLGANALMGSQKPPGYGALSAEATGLQREGAQLRSDAMSGTLPPGMNDALMRAAHSVATQIRSTYARSGQSGSSAEAQDIANLSMRVQDQGATMAMNLLQSGIQETQLSSAIYEQLMQTAIQQDQALATGIGNFATALASMGRPVYQFPTAPVAA